jgi:hypothetical protein
MYAIERLDELSRVPELELRTWLEDRMMELFQEDIEVRFWLLEPGDDVLAACWLACWGRAPVASDCLEDLLTVIEYVEEQPSFFAAVVPANHEAALILIVPKTAVLDTDLLNLFRHASVSPDLTPI